MPTSMGFQPPEFHAPPPSPEGVERSEAVGDHGALEIFLDRASSAPKLFLPDRIFPRQIPTADPPEIDFRSLGLPGCGTIEEMRSAARRIGCFQLVNHGVPREVISAAEGAVAAVFGLGPEEKVGMVRSSGKRCGFEGGEEGCDEELFWWRRGEETGGEATDAEMAGIWPQGYPNFSYKIECLQREIGKIASKIGKILFSKDKLKGCQNATRLVTQTCEEVIESTLCIHKYKQEEECSTIEDSLPNVLRHDAVRLLIRSCEHPHALCIHVATCSSCFQVFSKRGWISFKPNSEALIVTIGNQTPPWTGSSYKHVMGKQIVGETNNDSISAAILYSSPTMEKICTTIGDDKKKTISLAQQAILAISLVLVCHIIFYLYM